MKHAKKLEEEYGKKPLSLLWLMDSVSHYCCLSEADYYIHD